MPLVDLLKLNVEDKISLSWDVTWETTVAIRKVTGDVQCGLLTDLHGGNALIPTCWKSVSSLFAIVSWSCARREYP